MIAPSAAGGSLPSAGGVPLGFTSTAAVSSNTGTLNAVGKFPQNCTSSIRSVPQSMYSTKRLRAIQVPHLSVPFSVLAVSWTTSKAQSRTLTGTTPLFIEHGENNLPSFRLCNDSEEYILDGRVRLTGWKYSIAELSMSQLSELQSKGKVTYAIINPQGIPTSSSLSGPFLR